MAKDHNYETYLQKITILVGVFMIILAAALKFAADPADVLLLIGLILVAKGALQIVFKRDKIK